MALFHYYGLLLEQPAAAGGSVASFSGTSSFDSFARVGADFAGEATFASVSGVTALFAGSAAFTPVPGYTALFVGTSAFDANAGNVANFAGTSAFGAVSAASVANFVGTSAFVPDVNVSASFAGVATFAAVPGYTALFAGAATFDAVSPDLSGVATFAGTSTFEPRFGMVAGWTGTSTFIPVAFGATFAKGNRLMSQGELMIWSNSFTPSFGLGKTLAATDVSGQVQWATGDRAILNADKFLLVNQGTSPVFVRWGVGNQTALLNVDMPISAYGMMIVFKGKADTLAGICNAGQTTSLSVMPGIGV